mmetsp:Transcript_25000/g.62442  ORF Transcript_25000/g.62442 Transcript_25000/m.62442 type:complete len:227 (+) Transcript_25000:647-1327(+)
MESRSSGRFSTTLRELTVVSCSCVFSVLRNSGSIFTTFFRSKAPRLSTLSTDTALFVARTIETVEFMDFNRFSTRSRSASATRSVLLRMIRSAKATCSTASFSTPSGRGSSRCCSTCFASTRVTMPSSLKYFWTSSSTKNVCATGAGSAMPVVSMRTQSSLRVPLLMRSANFLSTTTRSWRTVQQMHPFIISMISSSICSLAFFARSASSMPTSPNSFSMIAIFLP